MAGRGHRDLRRRLLDEYVLHHAVIHNRGIPLRAVVAEEGLCIKAQAGSSGELHHISQPFDINSRIKKLTFPSSSAMKCTSELSLPPSFSFHALVVKASFTVTM
jgi:hypothetical protein